MRNKRLDILRCIAVVLVLLCHADFHTRLMTVGWVGVDLFFVLSGFLISGLLFAEYKKRGAIDFKRFLIRRALKIYPAFYLLLLATLAYQLRFHQLSPLNRYFAEMFYFQNYGAAIWDQTWSLAVEEHFYILLPLFLLWLQRKPSDAANPFRIMPRAFLFVAIACLAFRVSTVFAIPADALHSWNEYKWAYATTHCRLDSLFFGVLLGYFFHFFPEALAQWVSKYRLLLVSLAAVFLSSSLIFPLSSRFMLTFGLTMLYLGFGMALLLCFFVRGIFSGKLAGFFAAIGNGFALVGMYSYSIYLWHMAVQSWGLAFLRRIFHQGVTGVPELILYLIASIIFGIAMSKLVEYPILRLRDRIFPATASDKLQTKPSIA